LIIRPYNISSLDAKWNYQALNTRRINTLRKQKTTGFTKEGVLALDDTGSVKPYARKTEGVAFQHFSTLKKEAYCNVAVASCFVKNSKHIPLNLKFYKTQDEFPLGKYDLEFKSKLDLAKELFNEAIEQNIPFSYTVFDSLPTVRQAGILPQTLLSSYIRKTASSLQKSSPIEMYSLGIL